VDAAVSVSYLPGWTVVAVTREYGRIGVDAVPADAAGLERVLPGETDARDWARVEAVLKADGRGLAVDPAQVVVEESADGWRAWIVEHPDDRNSTAEWRGWDLDGPEGVVAALAVDGPAEARRRARPS
jgi:4'-phosphopantetheinyl transferase